MLGNEAARQTYEKAKKRQLVVSDEYMSAKQRAKVKSKAYISSSDDDSSGDEAGRKKASVLTASSSKSASPQRG